MSEYVQNTGIHRDIHMLCATAVKNRTRFVYAREKTTQALFFISKNDLTTPERTMGPAQKLI